MARPRKTLEKWISERIDDPDRKPDKLTAVTLFHTQAGGGRTEVHSVQIGRFATVNAKEVADTITDMAMTHSQDLPGTQMYDVQAFYGSNTTNPAHFPMKVENTPTDGGHMFSEPPTPEGRMAQRMRMEDSFMALIFRRQQVMDDTAIRREEIMGAQVARLQHELNETWSIMRELFMKQKLEDHQMAMAQMQYARDTEERRKIIGMLPPLANTLSGREIFPQNTQDTALMEQIAEALMRGSDADMAKVQGLAGLLPPALQMTLFARLQEIAKRKNDEREELERLSRAQAEKDLQSGDPEVAGELPPPPTDIEEARKKKKGGDK